MKKAYLGRWTFESGNACHATLEFTQPSGAVISFAWKSALSDEDRDRYTCDVLPEALRHAVAEVDRRAIGMAVLLDHESQGLVERVGVTEDGDTLWQGTEKGRTMATASQNEQLGNRWSKLRRVAALDWLRGLLSGT